MNVETTVGHRQDYKGRHRKMLAFAFLRISLT
jgi:hypothetical protein